MQLRRELSDAVSPQTDKREKYIYLIRSLILHKRKSCLFLYNISYFVDAENSDNKLRDRGVVCPLVLCTSAVLELNISEAFQLFCVFSSQAFAC